jgi:DNA topoisomerase IB
VLDEKTRCASSLDPGYRYVNHSPTGFEWGFLGSGPAQLAFAILLDHYGAPGPALLFYQDFKEREIATLNHDKWEMTTDQVQAAIEEIKVFRSRARTEKACPDTT